MEWGPTLLASWPASWPWMESSIAIGSIWTFLRPSRCNEPSKRRTAKSTAAARRTATFTIWGQRPACWSLLPQGALVAHIGDSRIYRVRQGAIEQLTFDHSLVWELRKAGQLSSAGDSAHGIPKNVITRSIGPNATVQVDIEGPYPVHQGDVFLVCSDGLTGRVEDSELAAILSHLPIAEAGQLLIDLANLRGGPDNVTLIVAKVAGEALLTQTELSEPLRIGHTKDTRSTQLLVWVATSVLLLVGLVLAITDRYLPALVAVLVSVVCWFGGWIAKKRTEASGVSLAHGRRLGKGPYTKTAAPAIAEAVDLLGNLTRDVRQQESASSPIDWTRFDQLQQRAAESRAAGRSSAALGDYARAVPRPDGRSPRARKPA